jgi:hypothetical protein
MEGQVFDFKIGDLKIQEKVGGLSTDRSNTYIFQLCKHNGLINKKHNQVQYSKGDNDFYWLNCADKKHFYIISEKLLIEHGYIDSDKKTYMIKLNFLSTDSWYNDYKFDYDNVDKEGILKLLQIQI